MFVVPWLDMECDRMLAQVHVYSEKIIGNDCAGSDDAPSIIKGRGVCSEVCQRHAFWRLHAVIRLICKSGLRVPAPSPLSNDCKF